MNAGSDVRETVEIAEGMTTSQISEFLAEKGVIRSKAAFILYVKLGRSEGALQAGKFVVRHSMSTPEVVTVLRTGKSEEMIVTIPEGFTVQDIDDALAAKGLMKAGDLVTCARECDFSSFVFLPKVKGLAQRGGKVEGYLFPDTYFVSVADFHPKFFLERLISTFRKQVVEALAADIKASGHSLHDIVTMAALIEEEAQGDEERATISGILWKRDEAGLSLGVDATVRYILGKKSEEITTTDLNVDSPYNTRKYKGFPPGPIANSGLPSIRAALHPRETPYWYYLHDSTGEIHYAKTNEEHNLNRMEYLQ